MNTSLLSAVRVWSSSCDLKRLHVATDFFSSSDVSQLHYSHIKGTYRTGAGICYCSSHTRLGTHPFVLYDTAQTHMHTSAHMCIHSHIYTHTTNVHMYYRHAHTHTNLPTENVPVYNKLHAVQHFMEPGGQVCYTMLRSYFVLKKLSQHLHIISLEDPALVLPYTSRSSIYRRQFEVP
jgi:hypothetical protein